MAGRDMGWWYWCLTVILLAVGLFIHRAGLWLAILLCMVQLAHVIRLTGEPGAFPVQVRAAYLALLVAGLWEPLQPVHWLQFAGTSARVLFGYCLLARTLSLAPWNHRVPLSLESIRRTFLGRNAAVTPCGAIFRGWSLERVQG